MNGKYSWQFSSLYGDINFDIKLDLVSPSYRDCRYAHTPSLFLQKDRTSHFTYRESRFHKPENGVVLDTGAMPACRSLR